MRLDIVTCQTASDYARSMRPLIEKCIAKAYHGEMTADDALQKLAEGKAFALVGFEDERVVCVGMFERIDYPRLTALNCFILAGKTECLVKKLDAQWMSRIRSLAVSMGADVIECYVSDPVARLLSGMGYSKVYNVCRMPLR